MTSWVSTSLRLTSQNIDNIGNQIIQELKDSGMPEQIALAKELEKVPLSKIWEDKNNNNVIELTNQQGDVVMPEFTDKFIDKKDKAVIGKWAGVLMGPAYLNMDWRDGSPLDPAVINPGDADKVTGFSAYDFALREQQRGSNDLSGDFLMWNGLHVYVDHDPNSDKVDWAVSIPGSQDSEITGLRHYNEHALMRQKIDGETFEQYMTKVQAGRGRWIFTTRKQTYFSGWCPPDALGGIIEFFGKSLTTPVSTRVIKNERKVILNELSARDGNVIGRVIPEEAVKRAYPPGHPEGYPTGGTSQDIKKANLKQIRKDQAEISRTPYRMYVHVAGNITLAQVREALNKADNPFYRLVPQLPARNRADFSVPSNWTPAYDILDSQGNKLTIAHKILRVPPAESIESPAALNAGLQMLSKRLNDKFAGQGEVELEYKTNETVSASNAFIMISVSAGDGDKAKEMLEAVSEAIKQLAQGPMNSIESPKWTFELQGILAAMDSEYKGQPLEDRLYGGQAVETNGRTENARLTSYNAVKLDDVVEMVRLYLDKPATETVVIKGYGDKKIWSSAELKKIDEDLATTPVPPYQIFGRPEIPPQQTPSDFEVKKVLKSDPKKLSYNRVAYELTNGVVVILVDGKDDSHASITMSSPSSNPAGKQGYTRLVGENLLRSPGIPAQSVAAELDFWGAKPKVSVGQKELRLSLSMPADHAAQVVHSAFYVMNNPARNSADLNSGDNASNFKKTKDILQYNTKSFEDSPSFGGDRFFTVRLGLEEKLGIKRGDLEFGAPADLQNITPQDLRNGHLSFINSKTLRITAAGIPTDLENPNTKAFFYELAQLQETKPGLVAAAANPGDAEYPAELEQAPYTDSKHLRKWGRTNSQVYYTKFPAAETKILASPPPVGERISSIVEYMPGPRPKDANYYLYSLAIREIGLVLYREGTGYIRWIRLRNNLTENDPAVISYELQEASNKIDEAMAWYPQRILAAIDKLTIADIRRIATDNKNRLNASIEEPEGKVAMSLTVDDPIGSILDAYKVSEHVESLTDADLEKALAEVKDQLRKYVDPKNPEHKSVIHILGAPPTR